MFIICDAHEVVQDRASVEANLSRGYNYPGYTVHEIARGVDVRVGDTYKEGIVLPNEKKRAEVELEGVLHSIVEETTRENTAQTLGVDYNPVRTSCQAKLTKLLSRKAALQLVISA